MSGGRRITPVILSGGWGSRLWPLSTPERPKQLLPLVSERTMLQMTAERVGDERLFGPPIIVTNALHADEIEIQLDASTGEPATIIVEPCARSTAPAIALAALAAKPDDLLLVLPSDHLILDVPAFLSAVERAAPYAADGRLVTFGVKPERPETGYGYILASEEIGKGVHKVARFVEKPDRETAETYVAHGGYHWNGGIFLFQASSYLEELGRFAPEIAETCERALQGRRHEGRRIMPDADLFAVSPEDSIDYAVMERSSRAVVVPVDIGWSDVGDWDALFRIASKDSDGNLIAGNAAALDVRNSLLRSSGPRVVASGVEDLIVVATPEAVLILPRGESQRVKAALEAAKAKG